LSGWHKGARGGGSWLAGREFVRFDIHLEIQFNFPVAIPLSRASQRVENRESRDEREEAWAENRKAGGWM